MELTNSQKSNLIEALSVETETRQQASVRQAINRAVWLAMDSEELLGYLQEGAGAFTDAQAIVEREMNLPKGKIETDKRKAS